MRVRVLYFAALRDLAGRAEEMIDLPGEIGTVAALFPFLEQHVPALGGRLASVRVARNEAFADRDEKIEDGDVIALIPPVAGGS